MRRYIEWIVRHRSLVLTLTVFMTGVLAAQIRHLRIVVDPNTNLPQQHPYVVATNQIEKLFGSKYVVIIGVTPREGDVFTSAVLIKVQRMTAAVLEIPEAVKSNILSLATRRAKSITGMAEGMEVRPLMETVPQTPQEMTVLRQTLQRNPHYFNTIVSSDGRTAAILAEFKEPHGGFLGLMNQINALVERERDTSVDIAIGGLPVFLAQLEAYSQRMAFLFPLALLITGLIHYEAFRTLQGLVLPLVTALLAVVWGLGIMGMASVPMDPFNASTPILILAVAAGHAVQILKRYYEEYHRVCANPVLNPHEANQEAVIAAVTHIGPVMLIAGGVAALGFLSLQVFDIVSIRTFGTFTGLGILSALVLEMTCIPALRSLLPAPGQREIRRERERRGWDRFTERIADAVVGPHRWRIYAVVSVLVLLWASGMSRVIVDSTTKTLFFSSLPFVRADRLLNEHLAGTNTLYLMVAGDTDDAMKNPAVLRAVEATQRFLEQQPLVGKTLSLADFLKRMNQAMHADNPIYNQIPESQELISQYLLLYSMAGEPTDFDSYVDYSYQTTNLWVFLKTESSAYLEDLVANLHEFLPTQFGQFGTTLRVTIGGSITQTAALSEVMVYAKILNMLQISGVILLITAAVFRSLTAGCLVLVPLLLAVLANFGFMGWLGIRLNIATSISSAMAVGIGADYAIYLIYRIREELARGIDETTAFRNALTTGGKAILFVASAIAGGYGVLLFSYGFYVHIWFALLIATAMLVSSVAALTLLPSLLLTFRPRFLFGDARLQSLPAPEVALVFLFAIGITFVPCPANADPLSAQEIMQKNFIVGKVQDAVTDATFTLINLNNQARVRKTFGTSKLQANGVDNMRMLRFLSPPDVKGTVTLLVEHSNADDDIWIYLPALKKVRRLVASNKKDSFVGTDFSYGDIIGHKVEDWEHRVLREEPIDGQRCYVVESLPRTEDVKNSSGYAKRVSWIRADNFVLVKGEFWDGSGQPLKILTTRDIRLVDAERGNWQPMQLEAVNQQTGHRTLLQFDNYHTNQQLGDEYFTTRYMEREP